MLLQRPLKRISARPRLVAGTNPSRGFLPHLSGEASESFLLVRDLPVNDWLVARQQHRHVNPALVCVQAHVSGSITHDRLLSYAALASKDANPRSYEQGPVVPY